MRLCFPAVTLRQARVVPISQTFTGLQPGINTQLEKYIKYLITTHARYLERYDVQLEEPKYYVQ